MFRPNPHDKSMTHLLENIEVTSTLKKVPPRTIDIDPTVRWLLSRPRITQHTDDWYAQRKLRITASDIAAVLGLNKYCSRNRVFKKKTGQASDSSKYVAPACEWGLRLESEAAKVYEAVTGIELIEEDIGLVVHEHLDCLGASPDRVAKYFPILIEIKCPYNRQIQPGIVPVYYNPQVQTQLQVCNMHECHFVQYIPPSLCARGHIDITVVERDDDWWAAQLPTILTFWDEVKHFYTVNGLPLGASCPDTKYKRHTKHRKVVVDVNGGSLDNTTDEYTACLFVGALNQYKDHNPVPVEPIHAPSMTHKPLYDISASGNVTIYAPEPEQPPTPHEHPSNLPGCMCSPTATTGTKVPEGTIISTLDPNEMNP